MDILTELGAVVFARRLAGRVAGHEALDATRQA